MISDKEAMEKILKEHEIDVVISAVGGANILDQLILLEAMKNVGTVKVWENIRCLLTKQNVTNYKLKQN